MVNIGQVKKAINGNDEAFLSIMFDHKEALFRTAIAYLKNEEDALEAVQEVTVRAYEKIKTLRQPEYVKTWLIRIMMNYCRDILREKKRIVFNEDQALRHGISDNLTYLEIDEALETLSVEQRELIYMRYLHEIKIKDIADMTSIPESTVKTRLYKSLGKLKFYFTEKGEGRGV